MREEADGLTGAHQAALLHRPPPPVHIDDLNVLEGSLLPVFAVSTDASMLS